MFAGFWHLRRLSLRVAFAGCLSIRTKDMYGEGAGGGHVGVSHFEPVPDADTGIAQRSVFARSGIGSSLCPR
eukprot:2012737-Rhodomonas_salina.3